MHTSKRHLQTAGCRYTTLLITHIYRNYLHQIQTEIWEISFAADLREQRWYANINKF